jgi:hypothetical protein
LPLPRLLASWSSVRPWLERSSFVRPRSSLTVQRGGFDSAAILKQAGRKSGSLYLNHGHCAGRVSSLALPSAGVRNDYFRASGVTVSVTLCPSRRTMTWTG